MSVTSRVFDFIVDHLRWFLFALGLLPVILVLSPVLGYSLEQGFFLWAIITGGIIALAIWEEFEDLLDEGIVRTQSLYDSHRARERMYVPSEPSMYHGPAHPQALVERAAPPTEPQPDLSRKYDLQPPHEYMEGPAWTSQCPSCGGKIMGGPAYCPHCSTPILATRP
ncbi:MAG: hypothetical protein JSW25_04235 [Thermoplasmata archaeon]|nr:MAG: hypothetical protein JSW25_04235 [Thermoplasmata archaeon]